MLLKYHASTTVIFCQTCVLHRFENHIDLNQPIGPARYEPICDRKLGNGARVLTLLQGIADPSLLDYTPEDGLKEVSEFCAEVVIAREPVRFYLCFICQKVCQLGL